MHSGRQSDQVRTVAVRDFDDLETHFAAWDRLAWDAPQMIPTLSPHWTEAFLRHRLAAKERWLCIFAYIENELVGALPVIITPHPILGQRHPLLRTPTDTFATFSGDIALSPQHAAAALSVLLRSLQDELPGHLGLLMKSVRQNSPVWSAIQEHPKGYLLRRGPSFTYSHLDVRADLDCYLGSLGKMRQNLKRRRRKLDKLGTVSVELRKGSDAGEDFLAEFLSLEASGWKGRNGTAIINDKNQAAFFTTLVRSYAAQQRWEWHIVRVNDRVVAAGMGVRHGKTLMLPKYAYDEDYAECTPGHLLMEDVIKEAFLRAELSEINPMSDASQHRLFRMAREEYTDVYLVRQSASAMLWQLPAMIARSAYHGYVRPRIPIALKEARRKLQRKKGAEVRHGNEK